MYFTNEVDEQNEEIPYERMKKIDWAMGIRILAVNIDGGYKQ